MDESPDSYYRPQSASRGRIRLPFEKVLINETPAIIEVVGKAPVVAIQFPVDPFDDLWVSNLGKYPGTSLYDTAEYHQSTPLVSERPLLHNTKFLTHLFSLSDSMRQPGVIAEYQALSGGTLIIDPLWAYTLNHVQDIEIDPGTRHILSPNEVEEHRMAVLMDYGQLFAGLSCSCPVGFCCLRAAGMWWCELC